MPVQPVKIACLHGYAQNAQTFRRKTGALRKSLTRIQKIDPSNPKQSSSNAATNSNDSLVELVYLDAPFVLEKHITPPVTPLSYKERDGLYAVHRPIQIGPSMSTPIEPKEDIKARTWWSTDTNARLYDGWNLSQSYLSQAFREHRFDGILGFSQGAVVASLICALKPQQSDFQSLRFTLLFSGFASRALPHEQLYEHPIAIPSLHIWGERDNIIPKFISEDLRTKFEASLTETFVHPKGHLVPGDSHTTRIISQFVRRFADSQAHEQMTSAL